jgi:uncharacterized protein YecE (DUF72 family)
MEVYLGTSGYVHEDWRGRFYPKNLPQEQWLEYYSHHFNAVEVNLTFYRLPASPVFRHWHTRTPGDFRFVLKGSREVSHVKRLRDCHEILAEFFERASELEDKLSCVLWQLPPKFSHDLELLEDFLAEMERVQVVYGKVRQAFEFRDISWFGDEVYEILTRFGVAITLADWPFNVRILGLESGILEKPNIQYSRFKIQSERETISNNLQPEISIPMTSDFLYYRLHGPASAQGAAYSRTEIKRLAEQLHLFTEGHRDIYIFFNNDAKAYAIKNAQQLAISLSLMKSDGY